MKKKRGHNEGSIWRRSNGRWRAQITLDGGRLSYSAKTRAEAALWLKEMGATVDQGLSLKAARITYGEFLDEWLISAKARLTFETWRSYSQLARDYISPALGKAKLRELSPVRIQRLYNHQIENGIGKRTVQKTHAVIRASLNAAKKMGLISHNPGNATDPPKPEHKEMTVLDEEQVRLLLETAKKRDAKNYPLLFLAIVTGMRQGELLALRWSDVDLAKGIIQVRFSLKRIPGKGLFPKRPKTKSSIRSVQIGTDTCKVLSIQRDNIKAMSDLAGDNWQDLDFVFPASNGLPTEPAKTYRDLQKLLQEANLPKLRFHDLRHIAASLMLTNGIDVLVASKRLGHAKPSITLDFYGHLLPSIQQEAANVLEGIIGSP